MKNQKGITLIALVITIIVLLILAGITIAMLTGDNGLLTRSQNSANDNAIAGAKDIVSMDIQNGNIEYLQQYYSTNDDSKRAQLDLRKMIEDANTGTIKSAANGCTVNVDATKDTITISKDNRKCVGDVTYEAGTGSKPATYSVVWKSMEANP